MRLTLLIILLTCQLVSAQDTDTLRVDFKENEEMSVHFFLKYLESAGLDLIYSTSTLPETTVAIPRGSYSVDQILEYVKGSGMQVIEMDDKFMIIYRPVNKYWSGYVRDKESGENLIGASLQFLSSGEGTVTNEYGYFSLSYLNDADTVMIQYLGYGTKQISLRSILEYKDIIYLSPRSQELEELTINSLDINTNITSNIPSEKYLEFESKGQVPYFLGEKDLIQKSLLQPGVRTIGEDAAGINVRGGGIDQNLLLLDEAVIYDPNHFYGLISVFNPEAVNRGKIYKGYIPPKYGGRASSVIVIHQKDGDKYDFHASGGLGIVSGRLLIEGPIIPEKSSFLISARQSLFDLSVDRFSDDRLGSANTSFQDFNMKLNWSGNSKNTFYISSYYGNDKNNSGFDVVGKWGNRSLTTRWNHTYGGRLFGHYSVVLSDYSYKFTDPVEAGSFIGTSNLRDYTFKLNHEYVLNPQNEIQFGSDIIFHRLRPGERTPFDEDISSSNPISLDKEHGIEYGIYLSHDAKINSTISAQYGFRIAGLNTFGPADIFTYDPSQPKSINSILDTTRIDTRKAVDAFLKVEPRASLNFNLKRNNAIKTSWSRTHQFIQLISNTFTPGPSDIWKLADSNNQPLRSDHFSLGYYQNFKSSSWQGSVEAYFKNLRNLISYKNGADLLLNPIPETELLNADGRAFGLEFLLEKKSGVVEGWISYTLSRTERKVLSQFPVDAVNGGNYFPENHDKTHDLSAVMIYPKSKKWSYSMTFNFSTGRPFTFPAGRYSLNGVIIPYFDERNQDRISNYHRLDISAKWNPEWMFKLFNIPINDYYWTFNLYNVYARKNAYSYIFRQSEINPEETEVLRYSVFGTIIPSATLNFKF